MPQRYTITVTPLKRTTVIAGGTTRYSVGQSSHHCVHHPHRLGPHFIVGGVLDRVIDQQITGVVHAQCGALTLRGLSEFAGGDGNTWKPLDFEPYSVVHTARNA